MPSGLQSLPVVSVVRPHVVGPAADDPEFLGTRLQCRRRRALRESRVAVDARQIRLAVRHASKPDASGGGRGRLRSCRTTFNGNGHRSSRAAFIVSV